MRGLYPIIDVCSLERLGMPVLDFARAVLVARPALVQLRAKRLAARGTLELLRALRPLCVEHDALLFANDRPDLALLAGCDGVHVGQDDLSASQVRRLSARLRIGVSTHDREQLVEALAARPFYVAHGPVFPTGSKERPDPVVGMRGLAVAADLARRAGCPLVAIGGITTARARAVGDLGALCAVIGGLLPPSADPDAACELAREMQRVLLEGA